MFLGILWNDSRVFKNHTTIEDKGKGTNILRNKKKETQNKILDLNITEFKKDPNLIMKLSLPKKQLSNNLTNGGWSSLIEKHNLNIVDTVSLPTVWTFDQDIETPYIYTKFK